jgi:hypothetical protein
MVELGGAMIWFIVGVAVGAILATVSIFLWVAIQSHMLADYLEGLE